MVLTLVQIHIVFSPQAKPTLKSFPAYPVSLVIHCNAAQHITSQLSIKENRIPSYLMLRFSILAYFRLSCQIIHALLSARQKPNTYPNCQLPTSNTSAQCISNYTITLRPTDPSLFPLNSSPPQQPPQPQSLVSQKVHSSH